MFSDDVVKGLADIWPLLATAIPLGVYNFTEAMNNVESAAAPATTTICATSCSPTASARWSAPAWAARSRRRCTSAIPGWKAVGGRIGYSLATGIVIALVSFLGLTALLLAVIPLVAILPILLFIGLVIGAQAFQASPARHAPAVVLAIIPNIAAWGQTQVDGALAAAGTSAAQLGYDKLMSTGVVYTAWSWSAAAPCSPA